MNFSEMGPESDTLFSEESADFYSNRGNQYTLYEWWDDACEDGFDIYLDSIRQFPDSVTLVKIIAKVVDQNFNDLIKPCNLLPYIDESTS